MLCNLCARLFRERIQAGEHHKCGEDIKRASRGGCYICRTVVGKLEGKRINVTRIDGAFKFVFEGDSLRISNDGERIPPVWWLKNCAFHLICVEDDPYLRRLSTSSTKPKLLGEDWKIAQDELSLRLSDSTAHEDVLSLAHNWLQTCINGHAGCHAGDNEEYWYPPRLVDVTFRPPRLIDCDFEPPQGPYVTFSYRRGEDKFTTLNADNMGNFAREIPFARLPQNFREAVQVTEILGLKYIWIDALCILQDGEGSDQDWRDNAAMMGKIYQNAELNISASCSPHADSGFFMRRGSTLVPQQYVYWHENKGSSLKFLSSKKVFVITQEPFSEIALSPLAKSGWALQERLYSPRILHFGARQILWECKGNLAEGGRRSETFPSGLPQWMNTATNTYSLRQYDPSIIGNGRIPNSWNQTVEEYSARRLQHATEDKFVALQSLALEFQARNSNDEYIAGLWKFDIIQHLMWYIPHEWLKEGRSVRARKGSTFRSPTWSWANIDGAVSMRKPYDNSTNIAVSYISHKIKPVDENHPTGQLASAEIKMKGHLIMATLSRYDGKYEISAENGSDIHKPFMDDRDIGETGRPEDMFGMLLFEYSKGKDKAISMAGLLLRQRSKSQKIFSRIGKWSCDGAYRPLLDYFLAQKAGEVLLV